MRRGAAVFGRFVMRPLQALAVASIVIPGGSFLIMTWHNYCALHREAETRARHYLSLLETHAIDLFAAQALVLQQVDERLRGLRWDDIATSRTLWEETNKLKEKFPHIDALFVVAPDGNVALTTRTFPPPDLNFADRDYFSQQLATDGGTYLGRWYVGRISNRPIFNLSMRRSSPGGGFDGVIGMSFFTDYFEDFYAAAQMPGDNARINFMRTDGEILVRYPPLREHMKLDANAPILKLMQSTGSGVTTLRSPVDGTTRFAVYQRLKNYPVFITYGVEESSILASWYRNVIVWGILTALVITVLLSTTLVALRRAGREALALRGLQKTTAKLQREMARRQRAEEVFLQAQKLEVVGQLTGGLAHDFNNLLTVIIGNVELAARSSDSRAVARFVKAIGAAAERGENLVRQLLAFSRRQKLDPEVITVNSVLENCRLLLARAVGDAVEIEFNGDGDLWPVRVDVCQLEAALLNLAVNARDAMHEGGKIVIETRNVVIGAADEKRGLRPGQYVMVAVADSGSGMTHEVMQRAFEPFFTTKEVGSGTGLGLSQVHGFVKQSGGGVDIVSEIGKGAAVQIFLPRSDEAVAVDPVSPPGEQPSGSATVLVVDDDENVRAVTEAMLVDLGYRVITAGDGVEALVWLRSDAPIDLLLADVVMPRGVNGVQLAGDAASLRHNIKVLLTTGHFESRDESSRGLAYLRKPYTRGQLSRAVAATLGGPMSGINDRAHTRPIAS